MKTPDELQEIEGKCARLFGVQRISVTQVLEAKKRYIAVEVLEGLDFTFQHLETLTEIVGSRAIDIKERRSADGCETCDFGVEYSLTFEVGY